MAERHVFPGTDATVPAARRWLVRTLGGRDHPAADAIESIGCELIANAVRHTRSGRKDGEVRVALELGNTVRLRVYDQGSDQAPEMRDARLDASSGRGLKIVASEADAWGTRETPDGLEVWAEVHV